MSVRPCPARPRIVTTSVRSWFRLALLAGLLGGGGAVQAQGVGIGTGATAPDASAALEVK
ncbi:hypothetical protein Q5H93_11150 [Hymenobacter sp. ASUV-10]|uniref:Uncharacterized protein n=1 Tax=Hymenobacter aranciens TaxID=3063996 RepID=A0ABT9BF51_9BACT|nr:hypothetical protein [Hymenobacter sp. ASUV-10]MDO7875291.1 hypothetical protein [Hymenobacter sp. ASUV-10]